MPLIPTGIKPVHEPPGEVSLYSLNHLGLHLLPINTWKPREETLSTRRHILYNNAFVTLDTHGSPRQKRTAYICSL